MPLFLATIALTLLGSGALFATNDYLASLASSQTAFLGGSNHLAAEGGGGGSPSPSPRPSGGGGSDSGGANNPRPSPSPSPNSNRGSDPTNNNNGTRTGSGVSPGNQSGSSRGGATYGTSGGGGGGTSPSPSGARDDRGGSYNSGYGTGGSSNSGSTGGGVSPGNQSGSSRGGATYGTSGGGCSGGGGCDSGGQQAQKDKEAAETRAATARQDYARQLSQYSKAQGESRIEQIKDTVVRTLPQGLFGSPNPADKAHITPKSPTPIGGYFSDIPKYQPPTPPAPAAKKDAGYFSDITAENLAKAFENQKKVAVAPATGRGAAPVGINSKGYEDPTAPGRVPPGTDTFNLPGIGEVKVAPAGVVTNAEGEVTDVTDDETGKVLTDQEILAVTKPQYLKPTGEINKYGKEVLESASETDPDAKPFAPESIVRDPVTGVITIGYRTFTIDDTAVEQKGSAGGKAPKDKSQLGGEIETGDLKNPAQQNLKGNPEGKGDLPEQTGGTKPTVERTPPNQPRRGGAAIAYGDIKAKAAETKTGAGTATGASGAGGGTKGGAIGAIGLDTSKGLQGGTGAKKVVENESPAKPQPKPAEPKPAVKPPEKKPTPPTGGGNGGNGTTQPAKPKPPAKPLNDGSQGGGDTTPPPNNQGGGGNNTGNDTSELPEPPPENPNGETGNNTAGNGGNGTGVGTNGPSGTNAEGSGQESAEGTEGGSGDSSSPTGSGTGALDGVAEGTLSDDKEEGTPNENPGTYNPPPELRSFFERLMSREEPSENVEEGQSITEEEYNQGQPAEGIFGALGNGTAGEQSAVDSALQTLQGSESEWKDKGKEEERKKYEKALSELAKALAKMGKKVTFKEVKQKRPNPMIDPTTAPGVVTHWFATPGADTMKEMQEYLTRDKVHPLLSSQSYQPGYQIIIDAEGNLSFTQPITPEGIRVVNHTSGADKEGRDINDNYIGVSTAGIEPNAKQLRTGVELGEFLKSINPNFKLEAHGALAQQPGAKERGITAEDRKVREGLALADALGQGGNQTSTPEPPPTPPSTNEAEDSTLPLSSPVGGSMAGVKLTDGRKVPYSGNRKGSRSFGGPRNATKHTGVDIPGKPGDPLYAVKDGVVRRSELTSNGYGHIVDIEYPDGTVHRMAHLQSRGVEVGDKVKKGQVVGKLGYSGNAGPHFPHVHYEVIKTKYYNSTGGRPPGREATRASLEAGRIDPREYFSQETDTQIAGTKTTKQVAEAEPVLIVPKSLIGDKQKLIDASKKAREANEIDGTLEIVTSIADLQIKVGKTKEQKGVTTMSADEILNSLENNAAEPKKTLTKEELAEIGSGLPDTPLGGTGVTPAEPTPVTQSWMSALPGSELVGDVVSTVVGALGATASWVGSWFGGDEAPAPEQNDIASLEGAPGKTNLEQSDGPSPTEETDVSEQTTAETPDVPGVAAPGAAAQPQTKTETKTVTTVEYTPLANTLAKKEVELNNIPKTVETIQEQKELLDDVAEALRPAAALGKVEFEEYNKANREKYTHVAQFLAGALRIEHVKALTSDPERIKEYEDKLPGPEGFFRGKVVTLGLIVNESALKETKTKTITVTVPVDGSAPVTLVGGKGVPQAPAQPAGAQVDPEVPAPAVPEEDAALEKGVKEVKKAVGAGAGIIGGVVDGAKVVIKNIWEILSGSGGGGGQQEDTHTQPSTTTSKQRKQ